MKQDCPALIRTGPAHMLLQNNSVLYIDPTAQFEGKAFFIPVITGTILPYSPFNIAPYPKDSEDSHNVSARGEQKCLIHADG